MDTFSDVKSVTERLTENIQLSMQYDRVCTILHNVIKHNLNKIIDLNSWTRSRNQQRNFETILQILQLRTQIFDVSIPIKEKGNWVFEFSTEFEGVYQHNNDDFGTLKLDCEGVPMLIGFDEEYTVTPVLTTDGSQQNIWFELVAVNN